MNQIQLHDVRRVAHIMGLLILEHEEGLIISTAGTVKTDRVWKVANVEEALQTLQKIRRDNHPLN